MRQHHPDGPYPATATAGIVYPDIASTARARLLRSGWPVWALMLLGVALRVGSYLQSQALWVDEAMLSLNILDRSFAQLLRPLDYDQAAPVGYLMLSKAVVLLLGNSELALRLVPLLGSIASLPLFYLAARRCVSPRAGLVALGLFVVSGPLLHYAAEVKPYATDVTVGLILLLQGLALARPAERTAGRLLAFAVTGVVAVWFSYPAVFVLAGIATTLLVSDLLRGQWRAAMEALAIALPGGVSFLVHYLVVSKRASGSDYLNQFWQGAFVPPPTSMSALKWYQDNFDKLFEDPVGLPAVELAAFGLILGCVALFRSSRRHLGLLIFPILFALVASALHKYPFTGRFLLFAVPSFHLLIAAGVDHLRDLARRDQVLIGAAFVGLLLYLPVFRAATVSLKPAVREEIRPVLRHIEQRQQPGDVLYVVSDLVPSARYYIDHRDQSKLRHLARIESPRALFLGADPRLYVPGAVRSAAGARRVWVIATIYASDTGVSRLFDRREEVWLTLRLFDRMGENVDTFKSVGVLVRLYDLRKSPG